MEQWMDIMANEKGHENRYLEIWNVQKLKDKYEIIIKNQKN